MKTIRAVGMLLRALEIVAGITVGQDQVAAVLAKE
jgi:hypothetical protein